MLEKKLLQSNVLIDELQRQVEQWKGKSDGDWFRDKMTSFPGGKRYAEGRNSNHPPSGAVSKGRQLVAQEEEERRRRHESIREGRSWGEGRDSGEMRKSGVEEALGVAREIAGGDIGELLKRSNERNERMLGFCDDSSLVSSVASERGGERMEMKRRDLSESGGNLGAARVELGVQQQSTYARDAIGHPRLDALLQSF